MDKVLHRREGRIARIALNRRERLNAIDDDVPGLIEAAAARANACEAARAIVLQGAGEAFCAGYELAHDAETDPDKLTRKMAVTPSIEAMELNVTARLATLFDEIKRRSPEGLAFKRRAEAEGWKRAARDREGGSWDWTGNRPING